MTVHYTFVGDLECQVTVNDVTGEVEVIGVATDTRHALDVSRSQAIVALHQVIPSYTVTPVYKCGFVDVEWCHNPTSGVWSTRRGRTIIPYSKVGA